MSHWNSNSKIVEWPIVQRKERQREREWEREKQKAKCKRQIADRQTKIEKYTDVEKMWEQKWEIERDKSIPSQIKSNQLCKRYKTFVLVFSYNFDLILFPLNSRHMRVLASVQFMCLFSCTHLCGCVSVYAVSPCVCVCMHIHICMRVGIRPEKKNQHSTGSHWLTHHIH